jgi:lipopolysaccharide transport system permease protein
MSSITLNPFAIAAGLARHRYLLGQLVKRDVLLRYRGAMFGVLWIFLSPLLMLAIFAFVFGHIFQTRWPEQREGLPFWLILYCGLIVFNVFGETVSRASSAVRGYPAYVKKIIFPVEILPLVPLGSALVHAGFNFAILAAALAWTGNLTRRPAALSAADPARPAAGLSAPPGSSPPGACSSRICRRSCRSSCRCCCSSRRCSTPSAPCRRD